MKIAITGGAGFIGSFLCERLIEKGDEVLCIDNFFTGNKKNVAHLLSHPNFEIIRHDIVDFLRLEVDQVYNFACPASPVHYQHNPIKTIETCVLGTRNMLELARLNKGTRLLHASTSEVYGDPIEHPQKEEYNGNVNPIGPRSCYDEGKRLAETLVMAYQHQHKIDSKIVRIFNTYGPKMDKDDGRVVSNFIVQALSGKDITVYGNGRQTRSFCYVDDLVEAIIRMMEKDNLIGPINIGNPGEFTILELAEMVIKHTESSSKIIFKPLPVDDPLKRCPNISQAKQHLNWQPNISLEKGLAKTIQYFKTII